jgi:AraC-like DNA-binding protein
LTEDATLVRPAPRAGVLRAAIGRTLSAFLARYTELPRQQMLAAAGVEPQVLADPNGWLEVGTIARLLDALAAGARDPALALRFALQMPWRDLGIIYDVVFHSPTVGAAFANTSRYFATVSTGASIWLDVDGGSAELHYGIHDPGIELHAQNTDMVFAMLTRVVREASGDATWAPREIQLRHPRPASIEAQAAYFRCPLRFGRPHDVLVVRSSALRTPLHVGDDARLGKLLDEANRVLPDDREVLADRVRRIVLASLRNGDISLQDVADRLGTSRRTLQRWLRDQGRSFHAVVAEVRSVTARRYVGDATLTLTEAAARLGYAELSSFSRAFRRWTGESALAYRRRMRETTN